MNNDAILPVIPTTVTVHLGAPSQNAENITVSFPDYIKNVASGEIYPTWPESALRANIYAQISYALNRIYTGYYRSQGYDFDITNSTAVDQSFVQGRDIFENISDIVDDIFDSYIRRQGFIEPLFAAYCDGVRTMCNGLSQWGSVDYANQGLGAYDILTRYYGSNIEIVNDVPIENVGDPAPPVTLDFASIGNEVRLVQQRLNRISQNYPAIPKIYPLDGIYDENTVNAVKKFQEIFNMPTTGAVDRATWYRILYIYNGVKSLNELISEGLKYEDVQKQFSDTLEIGAEGIEVEILQYYLRFVSAFEESVPRIAVNGVFDEATAAALRAFQRNYGLDDSGVSDLLTFETLYDVYRGLADSIPDLAFDYIALPYPGVILRVGSEGEDVVYVQENINTLSEVYTDIPSVEVSGYYNEQTANAVRIFQRIFGLSQTGNVSALTWKTLGEAALEINSGYSRQQGQYPGYEISQ